ncbi:MFS transporter [Actinopolymorpha sp. B17G11]|uniref:MFS transporter n=1 Tax=Actinopolymorpha sp. B17G11 TaxID=3160861 RepID=UPI0032E37551
MRASRSPSRWPALGGTVTALASWEWIFWLNVPIGLMVLPLLFRKVPETHGARAPLDLPGLILVTCAALGLIWALVRAAGVGWTATEVVGGLAVGALLLIVFLGWERHTPHPMVPVAFFQSRGFATGNIAALLHSAVILDVVFWMAQFLQTGLGYNPIEAGLRLLPWTGTMPLIAPLAGALADRYGNRIVRVSGLLLQAAGMLWLALIAAPGTGYTQIVGPLILSGIGASAVFPAVQNTVLSAVRNNALGQAAGVHSKVREFGGMLGIAILGAAFANAGGYANPDVFTNGFTAALTVATVSPSAHSSPSPARAATPDHDTHPQPTQQPPLRKNQPPEGVATIIKRRPQGHFRHRVCVRDAGRMPASAFRSQRHLRRPPR